MTGSAGGGGTRYRLDARIATGATGEVWRATDILLEREVAVKLLKRAYAGDPAARRRFETEARHAAALHHPNVAAVLDFGRRTDEDGLPQPYLVMELVPGQPLSALLRDGVPMLPATAARLVGQAAGGIAAAHRLGVVHRDVKPANLLVTPDGTVKITDFGIARAADAGAPRHAGQVVGTPQYLSPEQARGNPATPLSDVYSLGVVLYECLAGRRPFGGDTPAAAALAHLRDVPPPLPDTVPAELRRTVEAALAKDPADRLPSAAAFAVALHGGPAPWEEPVELVEPGLLALVGGVVAGAVPGTGAMAAAAAGLDRPPTYDGPSGRSSGGPSDRSSDRSSGGPSGRPSGGPGTTGNGSNGSSSTDGKG